LLLEEQEVRYEEEGSVGGGRGFCEESAGVCEGEGRTVNDVVGEVVENGGLGCVSIWL